MTDEMKPVRCGCGGEAKVIMLIPEVYAVECSKCWIRTGSPAKTEAEAVTAWNRAMGVDRKLDEWCTDCKEYDHEKQCYHRWNRVIKNVVDEVREKYDERTAKVETVEKPNVYKCGECGQYFHSTAWGSPVEYCSRCGARLEWE